MKMLSIKRWRSELPKKNFLKFFHALKIDENLVWKCILRRGESTSNFLIYFVFCKKGNLVKIRRIDSPLFMSNFQFLDGTILTPRGDWPITWFHYEQDALTINETIRGLISCILLRRRHSKIKNNSYLGSSTIREINETA